MGYCIQKGELATTAIRRIACEQIDNAIEEIENSSLSPHEIVHQLRKRCKKLRGLLHLVRSGAGPLYEQENEWFRDSAHALTGFRDAQALTESCEKLLNHYADTIHTGSFAELEHHLALFRDETLAGQSDLDEGIAEIRQRMLQAKKRVEGWSFEETGFVLFADGLTKTYQRCQRSLHVAYRQPTAENFHEWRKGVKYHWYHMCLLRNLWPELLKPRAAELEKLSEYLGDEHDLTLFENCLQAEPNKFGVEKMIDALIGLLRQRQEHLREAARPLGERLFAEKTSCLVQRFERYWKIWQESQG